MGDSGADVGFNPAAMMAGMAVGQNIAGTVSGMMAGVNQPIQAETTPPPVPTAVYHVAVNGQAVGPYDMSTLAQMVSVGQLRADSLVWKAGMTEWAKAGAVGELKGLFTTIPPIPPVIRL